MNFCEGVCSLFLEKNLDFSIFCFNAKWINKKCFRDVVERKDAFLGYKNFDLKKAQNLHFSKRVHGFCQKIKMFSSFVLLQNESKKVFGKLLEREEAFFDHEKHRFKTNS